MGLVLPAVYQQRVALLAHHRDELVHDPTRHASKGVLGFLACQCLGYQVPIIWTK